MSNYRRSYEGNTYFFTVVTYQRQPILCLDESKKALREAISAAREAHPFKIKAWVLLPDHLHCIWELPEGDTGYSMRWGLIKKEFTKKISRSVGAAHPTRAGLEGLVGKAHPTESRIKHREGMIWQRRFWEHKIKDERDYRIHCDYIHYNPVKHGLVSAPVGWEYSTFHRYLRDGIYSGEWGSKEPDKIGDMNLE